MSVMSWALSLRDTKVVVNVSRDKCVHRFDKAPIAGGIVPERELLLTSRVSEVQSKSQRRNKMS